VHRFLLKLGPITVYSYGAMLALAFIIGTILAAWRAGKTGVDRNKIIDLIFYILVSSLLGARILFVALNWSYYASHFLEIFQIWEGGLVFYGGLILAFIATAWFIKKNRLPFGKVMDILAPSAALGIAIGRIGCFLNGCCWGKLSYKWGIRFPFKDNPPVYAQQVFDNLIPRDAACSLPVIPAQLYESGACLIMFVILLFAARKKRFDGFIFWLFICLYSAFRFAIEYFRYYEANFILGNLTVSQVTSMGLFILSLAALAGGGKFIVGGNKK
jgi:phosphatidylglycerol---prolipoprotein diacylglyceryl transferase